MGLFQTPPRVARRTRKSKTPQSPVNLRVESLEERGRRRGARGQSLRGNPTWISFDLPKPAADNAEDGGLGIDILTRLELVAFYVYNRKTTDQGVCSILRNTGPAEACT
jgi:hypothetical protein